MKKLKFLLLQMFRGAIFSFGDIAPGVSGSTMAVILKFYYSFVTNMDALLKPNSSFENRKNAFIWFFQFGIGWLIGIVIFSFIVTGLSNQNIFIVSSLFLGLVLASIVVFSLNEKLYQKININWLHVCIFIVSVLAVYGVSKLTISAGIDPSIFNNLNPAIIVYIIISGIITAGALLLPGFGGSSMLLIFGLYGTLVSSVTRMATGNFQDLGLVITFGIGMLIGLALFSDIIKNLMLKHKMSMNYLILGLMTGSVYAVIVSSVPDYDIPLSFANLEYLWLILGIVIIIGLDRLGKVKVK